MPNRDCQSRRSKLFTDRYIKSLKAKAKMYQVREGRGFAIRVLPSGVKTWYYVYQLCGKRRQLNLGNYPNTSLEDAHEAYRSAYDMVKKGVDPQGNPNCLNPITTDPEHISISELTTLYLQHIEGHLVPLSVVQQRRVLKREVLPVFGEVLASKLQRRDAIRLIEKIAQRAPGQARNVIKTTRAMFSYALDRDWVEHNPFSGVGRAVPVTAPRARSRTLSEKEIVIIWGHLVGTYIGRIILLVLITGQRPGEVTGMKWDEIEGVWWIIPAERAKKNGRETRVYLSRLARVLMPRRIEGEFFVFPARGRGRGIGATGGMRPGTVSRYVAGDNDYFQLRRWTPHDLRRTMATELARLGCPDEVIDEILNHKKKGIIGVYNKYRYDSEKRDWLRTWSKTLITTIKNSRSS